MPETSASAITPPPSPSPVPAADAAHPPLACAGAVFGSHLPALVHSVLGSRQSLLAAQAARQMPPEQRYGAQDVSVPSGLFADAPSSVHEVAEVQRFCASHR
jgi:hypothetical protein